MRFVRPILALAALFAALPAAADDGRRHVMTPTQKIDMVRDLPDIGAFERDGMYYDLGYIYPIHTVNGASVASAGSASDSGFVLYHDDRYIRADSGIMADLETVLGEDPTQGYTPPKPVSGTPAAADPWGANGKADAARGEPVASSPGHAARTGRGIGIFGTLFLFFLVLFLRVRLFRDLVIGGMLAAIAGVARGRGGPDPASGQAVRGEMLASQAAAQRARLDSLSSAPASSISAAPGGFGRKGL